MQSSYCQRHEAAMLSDEENVCEINHVTYYLRHKNQSKTTISPDLKARAYAREKIVSSVQDGDSLTRAPIESNRIESDLIRFATSLQKFDSIRNSCRISYLANQKAAKTKVGPGRQFPDSSFNPPIFACRIVSNRSNYESSSNSIRFNSEL
jgi:hypothetical protein